MADHRISDARGELAAIVNRAAYAGERVRLTRHGKPVAAVVPIADAEFLEELEDEVDLELVRTTLADPANESPIPWDEVKRRLDL